MTSLAPTTILFDLDGTIVDSAPGITSSLAWTLERMGEPVPSPQQLLAWVGPPIMDSFRDLGGFDVEESHRALAIYREHYLAVGVFDAQLYPGVPAVLEAIHSAGIPLSLATSKPETPARLVLDHFELSRYFDEFTGASDDETRSAKADVVEEALRRLAARGADLTTTVHVGDRHHDVEGAAAHRVGTVFVTWGYGSEAEQEGALAVVDTAPELAAVLGVDAATAA